MTGVALNLISIAFSIACIRCVNKRTSRFGPTKTLTNLFLGFCVIHVIQLLDGFTLMDNSYELFLLFFEILVITTYFYEIKKIKYEGNWMPSDILNNLPIMLWVKDINNRFLYVNDAICKDLLLCSKKVAIGKTSVDIAKINIKNGSVYTFGEVCDDSDQMVMLSNKPDKFLEIGKVNGSFIALQVAKAPLYDDSGNIIGTIGCGSDITLDMEEHIRLEKLYKAKKFKDFEKLFESHKYKYLQVNVKELVGNSSFNVKIRD